MAPASITGSVRSATTNSRLSDAVVSLISSNGIVVETANTGWSGEFSFSSLVPGIYTVKAVVPDHMVATKTSVPWNEQGIVLMVSPKMESSTSVRFVMTWSSYPKQGTKDMDMHLLFRPTPDTDCDVNFMLMKCGYSRLDVDNIQGGQNGAETITIEKPLKTVYTLFLDNYSGDLKTWRGRSQYNADTPLQAEINDAAWMWPAIPASDFEGVPPSGWATEMSGAKVSVLHGDGEIISVKVPSHPEVPGSQELYRDKSNVPFDGGYRHISRYVRMLCIDFRGAVPRIYKVPQFSASPPVTMASCV